MIKIPMYRYLGTNGIVTTPTKIDGVYHVKLFRLIADDNKILVNGDKKVEQVLIPEEDLSLWTEKAK